MSKTDIEWTEETWNPTTGCTKVSPGCLHCYAERMAYRLQAMGKAEYSQGFKLTPQPQRLSQPLGWKKGRQIFVNSMSDLFHKEVSTDYIKKVVAVIEETPRHTYQVLTKRAERLKEIDQALSWSHNLWLGVTVENADYLWRVDLLRNTSATVKFLSLEPLLGPIPNLNLEGIDWVIVGGESGPGARPMPREWVREIKDQCLAKGVSFFFKQWGGSRRKAAGRELDGRTWDERPACLLVN
jgi:protein gp37